jgi:hypothetical protein
MVRRVLSCVRVCEEGRVLVLVWGGGREVLYSGGEGPGVVLYWSRKG